VAVPPGAADRPILKSDFYGHILALPAVAAARRPPESEVSVERGLSVSVTDELVRNSARYAETFASGDLPMPPGKQVAVLTCMDARINPYGILGLSEGDAHVIRNAGGVVTEDAVRSLVISQRLLGTTEIVLIHHTDCGMLTFRDDEVKAQIEADSGLRPSFALEAFSDVEADVRQSLRRVRANPFIPRRDAVRGFVYDVESGRLDEVQN
jgi:carbonic anhydrase